MKYMIMMFAADYSKVESRSEAWMKEMQAFMHQRNRDLSNSGELVDAQGLVDPRLAKTVRLRDGHPIATDGPYAESKESLAGYWIVDVKDEARAIEIASKVVAFIDEPDFGIEVRAIGEAPAQA